jgi:hypothetical protein
MTDVVTVQTKSLVGSKTFWLSFILLGVMILQSPEILNLFPQYRSLEGAALAVLIILQTWLTRDDVTSIFPHSDE